MCVCVVHPLPLKVFFIITAMIDSVLALWLDSAPRMRSEKNTMRGKINHCIEGNKMSTPERMKRRKSLWIEHKEREREEVITHTYIYIYIYIRRERERESVCVSVSVIYVQKELDTHKERKRKKERGRERVRE